MSEELTPLKVATEDLRAAAEDMEQAAWRTGLTPQEPLGIWVVTMRRTVTSVAELVERQANLVTETLKDTRGIVQAQAAKLQAIGEAATVKMREAEAALTKAKVESEKLTLQTLHDLTPKIVDQIRDAVVIREKRYNRSMRWRHYALVSAATVGLMVGGYSLRAYQDLGATNALARCAAATIKASDGSEYCALKSLLPQQGH